MRWLTRIGPLTRVLLTLLTVAAVYLALAGTSASGVSLLVAWCTGAAFWVIQIGSMFASLDPDAVRARCQGRVSDGHLPMLLAGVLVAFASVAAVIYLLDNVEAHAPYYRLHVALSPLALAHTLICFFYYTVIIGLVMNAIGTVF
jgi:uncharacterized membrane protein